MNHCVLCSVFCFPVFPVLLKRCQSNSIWVTDWSRSPDSHREISRRSGHRVWVSSAHSRHQTQDRISACLVCWRLLSLAWDLCKGVTRCSGWTARGGCIDNRADSHRHLTSPWRWRDGLSHRGLSWHEARGPATALWVRGPHLSVVSLHCLLLYSHVYHRWWEFYSKRKGTVSRTTLKKLVT